MSKDVFAEIAEKGIGGNMELLYEPAPPVYKKKKCVLKKASSKPMATEEKMCNSDELSDTLEKMRKKYLPYLEDYTPRLKSLKKQIHIKNFVLDGNEEITIPHYGGPTGYAQKIYESEFVLDELPLDNQCAYICFEGVDYFAEVFVNGEFVGKHEGFFAPFEYDISDFIQIGKNTLKVKVKNDNIIRGNIGKDGKLLGGDKIYAATGLGWDDAMTGWHHCPSGMGIYNDVYVEIRNTIHISDMFVRPMLKEKQAEVWIEVQNAEYDEKDVSFLLSLYGQNFECRLFEKKPYVSSTIQMVGVGDSVTAAERKDILGKSFAMPAQKGKNLYKFVIPVDELKLWNTETPFLYNLQAEVVCEGVVTDNGRCQFGMREFTQDLDNKPYGMFYLNGKKIRLRGANTMGFEQQNVMRGDYAQLIDDILLAKICNMNFLRLTQRPVQKQIYEYCDKLGLMTQTDLPLFGCMRRTKVCDVLQQVEDMEKLVRSHPCNVIISYINEPFPNADNAPHRHLNRMELENFFDSCDFIVHLNNPDRVIKHVDGDYDPPTKGMPDNHCYPGWYNGHGIDIGKLHKGYWMPVKPDWCYGCGEYGAEGLECAEVMDEFYPKEWLKEPFNPKNIVRAQTADFHYFFYDTPKSRDEWIEKSQIHQAFVTRIMTEAFRRNNYMISNAIHLFIDAWPSGWMKTIMDCKRNPKKAFFTYRNALEPVLVSLRTDKFKYTSGEKINIETVICNDTNNECDNLVMHYEVSDGDDVIFSGQSPAIMEDCVASYVADAIFIAPKVDDRKYFKIKAILTNEEKEVISYNELQIEILSDVIVKETDNVVFVEMLPEGEHEIAGEKVAVKNCGMLPLHFASARTKHEIVKDFSDGDFSYWYDQTEDMITPILYATFKAEGFTPVIISGNKDENDEWGVAQAVGVKEYDGKLYVISQLDLRTENPIAKRFVSSIYNYAEKIYSK